jgi:hypothetical protein
MSYVLYVATMMTYKARFFDPAFAVSPVAWAFLLTVLGTHGPANMSYEAFHDQFNGYGD